MIQKLNNYHAYKAGSDIWFLPEKKLSHWARNLDWYVNFLYSKAQKNTKKQMSETVKIILKEEEMSLPLNTLSENHVLLLSSSEYLPNRALAFVKNVSNVKEWIEWIENTAKSLKTQSIRIFLPKGLTYAEVQKLCQKFPEGLEVTIVEDGTLFS